ncbi:MAG: shikimate dehydrogenase [Saprospiraceae bacterium]|nr:shikimate dehydrogenase [Bacteroidia bacterium]NNL91687.1 shikimate dehydrogenase [Saprospiraceae bacterium]
MRRFGLIGYPLTHSFSPSYFKNKFEKEDIQNTEYKLYPIEEVSQIMTLFESDILGLNVTIPYKESVIPFLDDLNMSALSVMAVNTIKNENGLWVGYNSDIFGFENSLDFDWFENKPKRCLILGTGGASKAVKKVMDNHEFETIFVSSSGNGMAYNDIDKSIIESVSIIVNTTPLGMAPNIEKYPLIPYEYLSDQHLAYDLIYNPEKTVFLNSASAHNARIQNGLPMLKLQAEKSWEIWNS